MHRDTRLWRAFGMALLVLMFAVPLSAAKRQTTSRTPSAHKVSQKARTTRTTVRARQTSATQAPAQQLSRSQTRRERAVVRAIRTYTVRRGDTLQVIAKRFKTTPQALAKANHLRSIHRITAGQVLRLPGATATGKASSGKQIATACDREAIVQTALKYRGVPYVYSGTTSRGLDCSGLVARVLLTHGMKVPHHAASLYKMGTTVEKSQLQSGDLVFFNTNGRGVSHVGIYIGDNKFIHASSGVGRVTVTRLDEGYYQKRYIGAKRILKN